MLALRLVFLPPTLMPFMLFVCIQKFFGAYTNFFGRLDHALTSSQPTEPDESRQATRLIERTPTVTLCEGGTFIETWNQKHER